MKIWQVNTLSCMLDSYAAHLVVFIKIRQRILVHVARFRKGRSPQFDIKRIGILKIFNLQLQ